LSKGQEWDWLGDPFGRIQTLRADVHHRSGAVGRLGNEKRQPDRQLSASSATANLTISCVILFCAFGVLYGTSVTLAGDASGAVRLRCAASGAWSCRPAA